MATRYRDEGWLVDRLVEILDMYYPTCIDHQHGGYVAQIDPETGDIYDRHSKHLVATCRFIVNFCLGNRYGSDQPWYDAAEHGITFLRESHYDTQTGGYDWLLDGRETIDRTRFCYGHAFVLLAFARAIQAGIDGAEDDLNDSYDLIMDRFWEPQYNLCKSEFDGDFENSDPYRGLNANMHTCEAMLAAYEATEDQRYLDRPTEISRAVTMKLAEEDDGQLWEHYTETWDPDREYNRDNPEDLFRPWGYQPGHHIEWAKLLCILDRYTDLDWTLDRAVELFDIAVSHGWDDANGGFVYTFDFNGDPIVDDKYGWPVAEGIGAAVALYERTDDEIYLDWYDQLWNYAETNLRTPGGLVYTKLTRQNDPIPVNDTPAVEPGYHPIGACFEAVRSR